MGLEKEIAEVFQQAIEHDLERISRSALPDYHSVKMAPQAMVIEQMVSQDGQDLTVVEQDYQIVGIELNPLGLIPTKPANPDDPSERTFKDDMEKIRERRAHRKMAKTEFEALINPELVTKKYHEAFHVYLDESTQENGDHEHEPVTIIPRSFFVDGGHNTSPDIAVISIGGVDYVHVDYLTSNSNYDKIKKKIKNIPLAKVDQWPEMVLIRDPSKPDDAANDRTYFRSDLVFFDASGNRQDLRFHPRPVLPPVI